MWCFRQRRRHQWPLSVSSVQAHREEGMEDGRTPQLSLRPRAVSLTEEGDADENGDAQGGGDDGDADTSEHLPGSWSLLLKSCACGNSKSNLGCRGCCDGRHSSLSLPLHGPCLIGALFGAGA